MGIFEKRFRIYDWQGTERKMTAKRIYEKVLKESESNHNWFASATELVGVCNKPGFPEEYAKDIKIAILNCFSTLELLKEFESRALSSDKDAVYYCYNSLSNSDIKAVNAKQKYLAAIIKSVIKYHFELPIYRGESYSKICREWERTKFEQYVFETNIKFRCLIQMLDDEFGRMIEEADKNGVFDEDKKREQDLNSNIFTSFLI